MTKAAIVPFDFDDVFDKAHELVSCYFATRRENPYQGTIEISGERYILVRSASMSIDFFDTVTNLYRDKGEEAKNVAMNLLFDIAHSVGKSDAKSFHSKLGLNTPLEKLSAGPIHFAFTGWAFVHIFPESRTFADERYVLIYDHPFSFESDAWLRAGRKSDFPVCIMNAGYSSGWCEESFGISLVASEIMCRAKGDSSCRFIMAPPSRIEDRIKEYLKKEPSIAEKVTKYEIPEFFKRKQIEEELLKYQNQLEKIIQQRTEGLKNSEERNRAIVNAIPHTIFRIAQDGKLLDYKATRDYLFIPPKKFLGCNIYEVIKSPLVEEVMSLVHFVINTGKVKNSELKFMNGNEIRYFELQAVKSGREEAVVILMDVADRKRLEEEIEKNRRLESVGILAGGIAHDFNNLLHAALSSIKLAMKSKGVGEESLKELTNAEKALTRAKGLTTQLLTFAKGGAPIKRADSISDLVVDMANFALSGSNVKCEVQVADDLWISEFDPSQMCQVINNLVINARESMPEGGIVKIVLENVFISHGQVPQLPEGKYIKIAIKDTGKGIPPENIGRIFDPFFTTKQHGSGLGLTICHSIISKHGGKIDVESRQGEGTTFYIYLPASDKLITEKEMPSSEIVKGKGHILLMDDEELVLKSTSALLSALGYKVQAAKTDIEMLELFRKFKERGERFDVIIMDLTVRGGKGGKKCIEEILSIDPSVKIVVSSGYSTDPIMANFKDYGLKGVLPKPYTMEELSQLLHNLIDYENGG